MRKQKQRVKRYGTELEDRDSCLFGSDQNPITSLQVEGFLRGTMLTDQPRDMSKGMNTVMEMVDTVEPARSIMGPVSPFEMIDFIPEHPVAGATLDTNSTILNKNRTSVFRQNNNSIQKNNFFNKAINFKSITHNNQSQILKEAQTHCQSNNKNLILNSQNNNNVMNKTKYTSKPLSQNRFGKLSCIYTNATSLANKLPELQCRISKLRPNVMFFSELGTARIKLFNLRDISFI